MTAAMKLLTPLAINGMTLPNRVVVPAMVTRLSGEDGYVNDAVIERYLRYAEGEVGLIVVEATAIHGNKSGPLLRLSDASSSPAIARWCSASMTPRRRRIVPQIIHFLKVARSGWRQTDRQPRRPPRSTSSSSSSPPRRRRAREAGYDGVELHSAHAYTLSSFLSRHNPRRDAYDGRTLEGRLHLFGRVMAAVRARVGADFPVGVRFLAEEAIKDGYTLARRPAHRLAHRRSSASTTSRSPSAASSRTRSTSRASRSTPIPAIPAIAACPATGIRRCRMPSMPRRSSATSTPRAMTCRWSRSARSAIPATPSACWPKARPISSAWRASSSPIPTGCGSSPPAARTRSSAASIAMCASSSTRISSWSRASSGPRA